MNTIYIDSVKVQVNENQTILQAAEEAGFYIPTLCHLKELIPAGACRICSVEVEGFRNLVPACSYPVSDGMRISTNNTRVRRTRKTIIELLVEDHPQDCLICVRSGNCELQSLSQRYGIREHRYTGESKKHAIDSSSPSLERDPAKCILCGRCVRTCGEIQKIGAIDFANRGFKSVVTPPLNKGLNLSDCILCGQCILVCPTAALREKSALREVVTAVEDKKIYTVVQIAPAVRSALGEEFGLPEGENVTGKIVSALRRLGFDKVFDTNFAADVTIMEEANELVERVKTNGTLPMFTSCCPGWVKYVETYKPGLIPHLSTCKSPHEMEGAIIKTHFAKKMGIHPSQIFVVSIMPCTVKKFEASRAELAEETHPDVDAVLTTRELARWIKNAGIDFRTLQEAPFDNPLGDSSGAAVIFGSTGGVMEAALRTAYYFLTGQNPENPDFFSVRGTGGVREAEIALPGKSVKVCVVSGIGNVEKVLQDIESGKSEYAFIEVMACPGGCVNGGGQPIKFHHESAEKRRKTLYNMDSKAEIRYSHENQAVKALYTEFLVKPGSHEAHEVLHTEYGEVVY